MSMVESKNYLASLTWRSPKQSFMVWGLCAYPLHINCIINSKSDLKRKIKGKVFFTVFAINFTVTYMHMYMHGVLLYALNIVHIVTYLII